MVTQKGRKKGIKKERSTNKRKGGKKMKTESKEERHTE
jgi:hypothetical protein